MKIMYKNIIILLSLILCKASFAQDCSTVSVEAFPLNPQSGQYNYFGVRVSLSQPYNEYVTVSGYIWDGPDDHNFNTDHPYTLTIYPGDLTAETSVFFYQTGPAAEGAANITSVSPCPETLQERIANSASFIQLNLLFSKILNMPLVDTFIARYDTAQLRTGGEQYLSNITGFPVDTVHAIDQSLVTNINAFVTAFPELQSLSQQDLTTVMLDAVNYSGITKLSKPRIFETSIISLVGYTELIKNLFTLPLESRSGPTKISLAAWDPCSDCKKVGRANMMAGIVVGAVSCSGGGWIGSWICAVALFYAAGQQTLACMRQHCQ